MSQARLREALTAGGPTTKDRGPPMSDGVLTVTPDTPEALEWRSRRSVIDTIASCSDYLKEEEGAPSPGDLYGRFTWRIDKFGEMSKRELRSEVFEVGGYKWYILVYPQGCDVSNHLSLFLCVADHDKLLPGWSHFAQFTIAVVNREPKASKYSDTLHRFCKKEHDWGWKKFMELGKLADGFLVQDALVIKAQVQVLRDVPAHPFRCLDAQYRRELVRVYLSNVEGIARRFAEERRTWLSSLLAPVDDSSFRAFWATLPPRRHAELSCMAAPHLLRGLVKWFFNEKEVTSTLIMDALVAACCALEAAGHIYLAGGTLRGGDGAPGPGVLIDGERGAFFLPGDVLEVLQGALVDAPSAAGREGNGSDQQTDVGSDREIIVRGDERESVVEVDQKKSRSSDSHGLDEEGCPDDDDDEDEEQQGDGKKSSSSSLSSSSSSSAAPQDGSNNNSSTTSSSSSSSGGIERDERRLAELGRWILDVYVISEIARLNMEAAWVEAETVKRQEALILEEEAAEQEEKRRAVARLEAERERRARKKEKERAKKQGREERERLKAAKKVEEEELRRKEREARRAAAEGARREAERQAIEQRDKTLQAVRAESNSGGVNAPSSNTDCVGRAEKSGPGRHQGEKTHAVASRSDDDVQNDTTSSVVGRVTPDTESVLLSDDAEGRSETESLVSTTAGSVAPAVTVPILDAAERNSDSNFGVSTRPEDELRASLTARDAEVEALRSRIAELETQLAAAHRALLDRSDEAATSPRVASAVVGAHHHRRSLSKDSGIDAGAARQQRQTRQTASSNNGATTAHLARRQSAPTSRRPGSSPQQRTFTSTAAAKQKPVAGSPARLYAQAAAAQVPASGRSTGTNGTFDHPSSATFIQAAGMPRAASLGVISSNGVQTSKVSSKAVGERNVFASPLMLSPRGYNPTPLARQHPVGGEGNNKAQVTANSNITPSLESPGMDDFAHIGLINDLLE